METGVVFIVCLLAGLAAAALARRLPARGAAALGLTLFPPLGLYYLVGAC